MTSVRDLRERDSRPLELPPSLAGASVGDEVLVDHILLNIVRATCHHLGITAGDRLRVEDRSAGEIVVRTGSGRLVRLPDPHAFFVRVTPVGRRDGAAATLDN